MKECNICHNKDKDLTTIRDENGEKLIVCLYCIESANKYK